VDDHKALQPHQAVKIWADQPTTILVAGRSHAVGPGDNQYAAALAGLDGTLTIASGSVTSGGGD